MKIGPACVLVLPTGIGYPALEVKLSYHKNTCSLILLISFYI